MICFNNMQLALYLAAAALIAPAFAEKLPEPVGHVARVEGPAYVSSRGYTNAAKVGQAIVPGVALSTGAKGRLGVILDDGSVLSFGPHSEFTLDEFRFAPAAGDLQLRAMLARGSLNLIAGDMARLDPDAVAIDTPQGLVRVLGGQLLMKVNE